MVTLPVLPVSRLERPGSNTRFGAFTISADLPGSQGGLTLANHVCSDGHAPFIVAALTATLKVFLFNYWNSKILIYLPKMIRKQLFCQYGKAHICSVMVAYLN